MGYLEALWAYLVISSPYLLFGLILSGVIHEMIPMDKVKKWLGGNSVASVFRAALVGIPLPLCSCSVIPTAVTLKKSGANNGATSAFLIATPESGIDSITLTYALIDLPMTIFRPLAAFCSAMVAGLLQLAFNNDDHSKPVEEVKSCCGSKKETEEFTNKTFGKRIIDATKFGYGKLVNDIALWLAIGIMVGALIDFLVPADFFLNFSQTQNRLLILAVGIPLYICATASTPIAVSLMLKGLSPGAALILLLVGPATNISNIAVLQKYIGKKGIIINVLSIGGVALAFSYIVDWFYETFVTLRLDEMLMSHDHSVNWVQHLFAVILSILILKGIYFEDLKPRLPLKKSKKTGCCG